MGFFERIFGAFSWRNRPQVPESASRHIPESFRVRLILFCDTLFPRNYGEDIGEQFWENAYQLMRYNLGAAQLVPDHDLRPIPEVRAYLAICPDGKLLDFIEYLFTVSYFHRAILKPNEIVAEINQLFAADDLPYELTKYVSEPMHDVPVRIPGTRLTDTTPRVIAYPQVIRKGDQVMHSNAIQPALALLADPRYATANQEYVEALKDYRLGDYGDCVVKCCSAFESVMKIICDTKGWPYSNTQTAQPLLKTIIQETKLDTFFTDPLLIIATLRNRLSTAHGAGTAQKVVTENVARYTLNATASAIIFLVNEAK